MMRDLWNLGYSHGCEFIFLLQICLRIIDDDLHCKSSLYLNVTTLCRIRNLLKLLKYTKTKYKRKTFWTEILLSSESMK